MSRGPPYQMLDLKLALYLPFLRVMEPGVFIAASDTIEVDFLMTSGYIKVIIPRHIASLQLWKEAKGKQ